MPAIVPGPGHYTLALGSVLIISTTWPHVPGVSGPNHGPVFAMADPDSRQRVEARLVTFDYSKCRHAPNGGGGAGPDGGVFQHKKLNDSSGEGLFKKDKCDP